MKELFDVQVSKTESAIWMTFAFQMDRLASLKERQLGKTILYTDIGPMKRLSLRTDPNIILKKLSSK